MPHISAWSLVAVQITDINAALCISMGQGHHDSPQWQQMPQTSVWYPVAAQAIDMEIKMAAGLSTTMDQNMVLVSSTEHGHVNSIWW